LFLVTVEVNEITDARETRENAAKKERKTRKRIMDMLEASAGQITSHETGIATHPRTATSPLISIREDASPEQAASWLTKYCKSELTESVFQLPPEIKCRPWDGAVNVNDLLKKIYGVASQGVAIRSFFGTQPPQEITVEVGFEQHRAVPFGLIDFPDFEGQIYLGQKEDPEYGILFDAYVKCPKKYKKAVDGFWNQLKDHIKDHSIYKGKAVVGVGRMNRQTGTFEHPTFLDPFSLDPNTVAYSQEVFNGLRASVWGPIRTAVLQRIAGLKLNRKTLLYGTFGTGKTLAGGLTARVAVNNGWTFIQAKTGEEDLRTVLKTAELLAPAIVFFEDIDILIESDPAEMSKMLEMFDGISKKDKEVAVLMTSNYIESLSKGMTRVGRIDSAIEIGSLDQGALHRLISNAFEKVQPYNGSVDNGVYEAMSKVLTADDLKMPDRSLLSDEVDFERIMESMEGYEPAFIIGTFNLAKSNAIIRTESLDFRLTTEDFVLAAETLRNQHDTHTNAADRPDVDKIGQVLGNVMEQANAKALQSHRVDFQEKGDIVATS